MYKTQIVLYFLIIGILFSCESKRYTDALTPEQALKSFQLNPDFEIQVYAAEPFVKDPVSMTIDDKGNAFVVEMPDYPYQPDLGKGKGRIRVLFDTNKDGRVDSSIIFIDSLDMATSLLPWKGGLIVTAAPNILYLKDTTGDFKADIKKVLYTGFFKDNMEAQITALRFNIDNWIYASNYGREGGVTDEQDDNKDTLQMAGADFRFRLDKDQFERETGVGQFGQAIDDWGHRFLTENSVHIEQPVIPWRYLHRHAFMPSFRTSLDISDHGQLMNQVTPAPYWRAERTKRRNAKYQEQHLDRVEYADDHFTGASGGIVYTGDAFPKKYYGNFFVTEVAGSLVHRDILNPSDSSPHYIASLPPEEKSQEFLASSDPWFRPTSLTLGQDGCLYLVDMYRQHIETPFAIPEDLKKDMDFMNGSDMGRIYRIVPKNNKVKIGQVFNFSAMPSSELVQFLSNPNQEMRLRAQRILVERQDKSIIPQVKILFQDTKDPRYKLHALYLLKALDALDINLVKMAIGDANPEIRETGLKLGESYPDCFPLILQSINDSSVQVAFQAVLSTGNGDFGKSGQALGNALKKYGYDKYFRYGVLSSNAGSSIEFLEMLAQQKWFDGPDKDGQSKFLEDFSFIIANRNNKEGIEKFLKQISGMSDKKEYVLAAVKGLDNGFSNLSDDSKIDPSVKMNLQNFLQKINNSEVKPRFKNCLKLLMGKKYTNRKL